MTDFNITGLQDKLEKNETKILALKTAVEGGFSEKLIREILEELCDFSESLKFEYSVYNGDLSTKY
jgi:hypothetical protein